jgi:flagellar biosynthesis/type III secretory pathway protein FliH
MSLVRGRVIKAHSLQTHTVQSSELLAEPSKEVTRIIPAFRARALEEGNAILAAAKVEAAALLKQAERDVRGLRERLASEALEQARASLSAEILALAERKAGHEEASVDRVVELSLLVAERVLGEAITVDKSRVRALAQQALAAAQGADEVRIEAHPDDVPELEQLVRELPHLRANVVLTQELSRGSIMLRTNLGTVDARLATQLALLRGALRGIVRGA